MSPAPVVVVGAGLAGLETARRLGVAGVPVLLLDARAEVGQAVHTTGIFVRRTLDDFELPEGCLGPPLSRVELRSPRGRRMQLQAARAEFRVGRMAELYRARLAQCQAAGVEWAPRTTFLSAVRRENGASRLTLRHDGRLRQLDASLLVGADGARSRVAAALGLSQNREWIVGAEAVFADPGAVRPGLYCWLDPRLAPGYIAWVVADGETLHLGVAGYTRGYQPAAALLHFRARVEGEFGVAGARPLEKRGGPIPVGGVLPRLACEQGLLVGDAAGAVSPLSAGGLDPAVRLSALAARLVVERLRGGDSRALTAYDGKEWRRRFRGRLALRRTLAALESPWLAEAGVLLLDTAPGRRLAGKLFFGRGSFPDTGEERGYRSLAAHAAYTTSTPQDTAA